MWFIHFICLLIQWSTDQRYIHTCTPDGIQLGWCAIIGILKHVYMCVLTAKFNLTVLHFSDLLSFGLPSVSLVSSVTDVGVPIVSVDRHEKEECYHKQRDDW